MGCYLLFYYFSWQNFLIHHLKNFVPWKNRKSSKTFRPPSHLQLFNKFSSVFNYFLTFYETLPNKTAFFLPDKVLFIHLKSMSRFRELYFCNSKSDLRCVINSLACVRTFWYIRIFMSYILCPCRSIQIGGVLPFSYKL